MTITIHRQGFVQRMGIPLVLAAILVMTAVAVIQNREADPVAVRTPAASTAIVAPQTASHWKSLQLVQDGYLPPSVGLEAANHWKRLQLVQDGYLPPAPAPESAFESHGLVDSRISNPR